ncbi:MAG TPA: transglycosylase SLT domain-containing protein, partial [Candidatus Binataceae bacterium]|nr:transglycosylase SLT domain-containing protein [Candidatus Binataceae bacterium]
RARWFKSRWPNGGLAVLVTTAALSAQTLDTLAHNYRDEPAAATRAAVLSYANAHPKDASGALALLVLGVGQMDGKQYKDALTHLRAAEKRLPKLADYPAYLNAAAEYQLGEIDKVERELKPIWDNSPPSPLVVKAIVLEANAYIRSGDPRKAVHLLEQRGSEIAPEKTALLLAKAYEAMGDKTAAAAQYQRVYTEFPQSAEASEAQVSLVRFSPLPAHARLTRCSKLIDGREYARARRELEALIPALSGADRDTAQVLIGATYYLDRDRQRAFQHLKSLVVSAADPAAERLFYLAQSARALDRIDEMDAALAQLAQSYPGSNWRLQALLMAGNYYVSKNQPAQYKPLFHACYESFGSDPRSSECHWRAAWGDYLKDRSNGDQFVAHLKQYPTSEHAGAALYYLGRIAESKKDYSAARTYFEKASHQFPNQYYGVLARERLKETAIAAASPSLQVAGFMATIPFATAAIPDLRPSPVTQARLERARLLASAGLDELADSELRFGARHDGQPHLVAVELARIATEKNEPDQGIRWIKHYAPGYLSLPVDSTTEALWRFAFPLPFWKQLNAFSELRGLDPYVLAGLIRQESEFNPNIVSYANAYGLTQVLPSTGRELSRRLNIRPFQARMLFTPEVNINIGTYYLRIVLDSLQGKYEAALASYNAGKSRVVKWLASDEFREPAEFVESIPIIQTREYVQSVLQNADVYRRLYGQKPVVLSLPDMVKSSVAPETSKRATGAVSQRRPKPRRAGNS